MKQFKKFILCTIMICIFNINAYAENKTIIGLYEHVYIKDFNVELDAKLDTGAQTSSLNATNIETFKKNKETWVRFDIIAKNKEIITFEKPVVRNSKIKKRSEEISSSSNKSYIKRPVINVDICLGKNHQKIEVNLTDRSSFKYPLLIGSRTQKRIDLITDPSLKYTTGKPNCNLKPT